MASWDLRFQNEYIRRLHRRLSKEGFGSASAICAQINQSTDTFIKVHIPLIEDGKTRPHLRLVACILASHNELTRHIEDGSRISDILRDTFVSIGRKSLRLYTQALLWFSRDPFLTITQTGKKRALEQYGREWKYRYEESDNHFTMIATKCFYYDFFVANEVPDLTKIFCEWDKNWISVIDAVKYGFEFERPTTMGYGGHECPFIFRRTNP